MNETFDAKSNEKQSKRNTHSNQNQSKQTNN